MKLITEKLKALVFSRRFWLAVAGAMGVWLQDNLGLTEQQAQLLVGLAMAWIVGDSIHKTELEK